MDLPRFTTAGSVDDGKSTLIGRLLYDSKSIFEDQLEAIEESSRKRGDEHVNLALLTDGLRAEREQGITIDVAYRYFATPKRKFIIADTPGHIQYTRNMVTGASTANLAIILIDARKGVIEQTKRHSFIANLLRIQHVVVAVNKMDLVDYSQEVYEKIVKDYESFASRLDSIIGIQTIPISALEGVNVVDRSEKTPWYEGPSLLYHLENVYIGGEENHIDPRFPVQWVIRPQSDQWHDFRGYAGRVAGGVFKPGDEVAVLPSGFTTRIKGIHSEDGEKSEAFAPQSVCLTLEDEIDISRGDILASADSPCGTADQFQARILWMDDSAMASGRQYLFKSNSQTTSMTLGRLKHRIDVNTLEELPAKVLDMNEIGVCNISLSSRVAFDPYDSDPVMGGFVIVDRMTNNTVGMGLIASQVGTQSWTETYVNDRQKYWSQGLVSSQDRSAQNHHRPL